MRRRRWLLVVALLVAVSGCDFRTTTPKGTAPLRYRDEVFTAVLKTSDLQYGTAVNVLGEAVPLLTDVYIPQGDTKTARPAIVWVHGGSFCCGDKTSYEIVDEANTFAKKGYVNFAINYRLSPDGCSGGRPNASCLSAIVDAMHDAQAAVRFLRANASAYKVDPNRIAIAGTSAGGITALNVGFRSDNPGRSGNPGFSSAVQAAVSLSGAQIGGSAGPGDAPSLLFNGTTDHLVPYQWAVNTVNNALAAGLISELTTWQGEGHVPFKDHRDQIIAQTTNFLYWMLDLTNAR